MTCIGYRYGQEWEGLWYVLYIVKFYKHEFFFDGLNNFDTFHYT